MKTGIGKILGVIGACVLGVILIVSALGAVFNTNFNTYDYNPHAERFNGLTSSLFAEDASYSVGGETGKSLTEADKIITSNRLAIETKNINKTLTEIETLVETYKGKIINKDVNLGDAQYGYISVKIPSDKGGDFVDDVNKKFNVSSYSTDVSDVTETYVSTERDIEELQRKIELYRQLEKQTPITNIDTRISIIDKISNLERQILYLKEKLNNIDNRVEYRDVTISLSAPQRLQGERNYWHNTMQMIISTFQGSLRAVIVIVVIALPFAILIGIPILIAKNRKKPRDF